MQKERDNSTALRIARAYINPQYSHSSEHITKPRTSWFDVPDKRWTYHLQRMTSGMTAKLDGIQVFRSYSNPLKWMVEGEARSMVKTIAAMKIVYQKMKNDGYNPLPYFKLGKRQKLLLQFWIDYHAERGVYPSIPITKRELHICDQQVGNILHELKGYGLASQHVVEGAQWLEWRIEEEAMKQMGVTL